MCASDQTTRLRALRGGSLAGWLLAAVTLLVYANSWPAPFVYDDTLAIPQNPSIRRLWPLSGVLLPQTEGGLTVSGRPILNLSFALNYAISGTDPWSYHVVNTLIHAGAGLLLFGIVRRTLGRPTNAGGQSGGTSLPTDPLARKFHTLLAGGATERSENCHAVEGRRDFRAYVKTAWRFCFSPHELKATAKTATHRASGRREDQSEWEKCGLGRPTNVGGQSSGASLPAEALALAIAALWALHPLQTQAVTYTVQRAESLMGFFYLLSLYTFVRATQCHLISDIVPFALDRKCHLISDIFWRRRAWLVGSVLASALGMGTKEVMVTAPLLVLLYDRTFVAGTLAAAWRARRSYYLGLAATWLVLGALVLSTGGNRGGTVGLGVGVPLWAYPLTQFQALGRYLGLGGWPSPLIFEYGTFWVERAGDVVPYAVIVLPVLAATVVALWRWPAAGFLGAWFFGILAPTSLAPGTIQMIVEHRMYLPLAAVIVGAVWTFYCAGGRRLLTASALIAVGFAALAVRRNHDYRSHFALWADTVAKRPLNPRAHAGLAEALEAAGRLDEAIQAHTEAVRLLPDESQYYYNLAVVLAEAGRTDDAVRYYQLSLRLYPREPRAHNNLAILLARLGRHGEALRHYAEAVRLKPTEPLYHYNLGIARQREGQIAEAVTSYEAALRLRSDYADAHFNLGSALMLLTRTPEALGHYATARRLRPGEPDYAVTYGGALLVAGRPADALAQFQGVLANQPELVEARYGAGNALAALRRPEEAIANYEAILQQEPMHANARFKLGNALLDVDRVAAAIPHYEAALRLAPQDAEMHHNLGIAFARIERWDDARRAFDEALRLKPDYPGARRSREQLRQVTGR